MVIHSYLPYGPIGFGKNQYKNCSEKTSLANVDGQNIKSHIFKLQKLILRPWVQESLYNFK
jgi:hypothetical protein